MYIQCLKKKRNPIKKKKPHPLIDLRKNMPEKQVIFFVRPNIYTLLPTITLDIWVEIHSFNVDLFNTRLF